MLKFRKIKIILYALLFGCITEVTAANAIALTSAAPTIDGDIDDVWNTSSAPVHSIGVMVLGTPTNNPAGRWRGMYDNNNFYFLFEITDLSRWGNPTSGSYWNGDAVEVCFRGGTRQYQLGYSYVKNGAPNRYGGNTTDGSWRMKDVALNYENKPGYILEISIPKSTLGLGALTTGGTVYMEVCVNQTSNQTGRQAQLTSFNNSDSHHNSDANYTAVSLADCNAINAVIKASGGKTSVKSNGTSFVSLYLDMLIPTNATVTYLWKKDGIEYTGKGSGWNNIRPTTAGTYTCDVTINGNIYTSNSIAVTSSQSTDDFKTPLPIVVVNTNGQGFPGNSAKDKRDCDVKIIWNEDGSYNYLTAMSNNSADVHYDRKAILNYRGSTSRSMAKKSYAFHSAKKDMEDGVPVKGNYSMFGLPEEKDWILYAAYVDKSMMRNRLAMELYREMGHYASSMRYVDLFVDGSYQGIYIFMEKYKRDANRINVTEEVPGMTPAEIGYIIKFDKIDKSDLGSISWVREGILPFDRTNCGVSAGCGERRDDTYDRQGWELAYPEVASDNDARKNYIRDWLVQFETALYNANSTNAFEALFRDYVDIKSFVDFMIIEEFSRNTDGCRASMFFTKDAGGKLKCTPIWDFEMGFGNDRMSENGAVKGDRVDVWQYTTNKGERHFPLPFWWEKLMSSQCFKDIMRTRWEELRKNTLSNSNIEGKMNSWFTLLSTDIPGVGTSPMGRNKEKWSWDVINGCNQLYNYCPWMVMDWQANYMGVGNPAGKTTSFSTQEVPLLKAWVNARVVWLDGQISNKNFGTILTEEQMKQCGQITEEDHNPNVNTEDAGIMPENGNVRITTKGKTILIETLQMENLLSVSLFDTNGSLLKQQDGINYFRYECYVPSVSVLIVKIQTENAIINKKVMLAK